MEKSLHQGSESEIAMFLHIFAEEASFKHIRNAPEKILKIVPELGKREHLLKLEFSRRVSAHLNIARNTSTSFRHFVSAIRKLTSEV